MLIPFFFKSQKSQVKGLFRRGQVMLIATIFFLAISVTIVLGVVTPVVNQIESVRAVRHSTQGLYAGEGVAQDVLYRLIKNMPVDAVETIAYGGTIATATTTSVFDGKQVVSSGNKDGYVRKNSAHLSTESGVAFNYGAQSGDGGIVLENSSSVRGNIFSNGPVKGAGSNLIRGDVVSAGPSGLVERIHATSSVYAHTIQNATVDKDAYYTTISNTTVLGTLHPGSTDQVASAMPITDAQIEAWKTEAATGGSVVCNSGVYDVSGSVTLGPKKIPCDLKIDGSDNVTLTGNLWVEGNVEISNTATVRVDPSLGEKSVAVIADKPSESTIYGRIVLKNSTAFYGSGDPRSFILFISGNRSAEQGGGVFAIEVQNSATGKLLLYASHGMIVLKNSVSIKEVTGYKLKLQNSAEVIYESGLANLLFTSGPAGGYTYDSWKEVE